MHGESLSCTGSSTRCAPRSDPVRSHGSKTRFWRGRRAEARRYRLFAASKAPSSRPIRTGASWLAWSTPRPSPVRRTIGLRRTCLRSERSEAEGGRMDGRDSRLPEGHAGPALGQRQATAVFLSHHHPPRSEASLLRVLLIALDMRQLELGMRLASKIQSLPSGRPATAACPTIPRSTGASSAPSTARSRPRTARTA